MRLIVNGEPIETSAQCVDALLAERGHAQDTEFLAVAVNEDVVRRAQWAQTDLKDGDSVEIITPRQGG